MVGSLLSRWCRSNEEAWEHKNWEKSSRGGHGDSARSNLETISKGEDDWEAPGVNYNGGGGGGIISFGSVSGGGDCGCQAHAHRIIPWLPCLSLGAWAWIHCNSRYPSKTHSLSSCFSVEFEIMLRAGSFLHLRSFSWTLENYGFDCTLRNINPIRTLL